MRSSHCARGKDSAGAAYFLSPLARLAETFPMGVKAGVEPLALWQAVRRGAAGRRFTFQEYLTREQLGACLDSAAAELIREITQGRSLN